MPSKKSVKAWLDTIDSSLKITRDMRRNYKVFTDYYRGKQWQLTQGLDRASQQMAVENLDAIVVNWVFNTIRTMTPTLFFKNPRIYASPTRAEYINRVPLVNLITNYDMRHLKIKRETKRTILRSLIGGLAFFETGYIFLEKEGEITPEQGAFNPEAIFEEPGEDTESDKKGKFTERKLIKDSPFCISRSIIDVVTDPLANVLEERSWDAIREVAPLEFVKKDPRFKGTKNLAPNTEVNDIVINKLSDEYRKNSDLKLVELWHIFDRWEGKAMTVARGHNGKLREFDIPDGYNLEGLYFNEDPESTEHISIVGIMKDQQDEMNKMTGLMIEHIERTLPRFIYDSNQVTDEETIQKLADSASHEIIGIPGGSNSILPVQFPSMSPDMYNVRRNVQEDMQVSSGLSDFQRGRAAKVPSATEAQLIEQSSRLRVDEGIDTVSDVLANVMTNIFKLRQQFTIEPKVVPIIGEDNLPIWSELRTYSRDLIQGEYEFYVEYNSTQRRDQDFEKNMWLQLGPQLVQLGANPQAVAKQLATVFEVPQAVINQLFPPQPPVQQGAPMDQGQQSIPPEILQLLGGGQ